MSHGWKDVQKRAIARAKCLFEISKILQHSWTTGRCSGSPPRNQQPVLLTRKIANRCCAPMPAGEERLSTAERGEMKQGAREVDEGFILDLATTAGHPGMVVRDPPTARLDSRRHSLHSFLFCSKSRRPVRRHWRGQKLMQRQPQNAAHWPRRQVGRVRCATRLPCSDLASESSCPRSHEMRVRAVNQDCRPPTWRLRTAPG